ncbi:MAG: phosphodiesterase [Oscillospiraceae bacterium]|nr:phosphodiesterase [Oscillospiraceae bacterium]
MRLLIASDLHGSARYCRMLLRRLDESGADKLLLLGDLLYHGPRNDLPEEYDPKAVLAMLNERADHIFCVRGNCDCEVDQMVLRFPILAEYAVLFVGGRLFYAAHGHRPDLLPPPPAGVTPILLCGHTHIPVCEERGGYLCCNPGSVSIPKENSPRGYLLLEERRLLWKALETGETLRELPL